MTDLPEPLPLEVDDDDEPGGSRRHALWAMIVLGCVAVIVGCVMVLLGGGDGPRHDAVNILPPLRTPASTPAHTAAGHSVGAERTRATHPATTASGAAPTTAIGRVHHGDPCAGASSCVVSGDGGALAAVNAYRTTHGLAAVTGGVTTDAQTCAANRGTGATCVPHYAWTSLPDQDGAKAVAKIAGFGSDWLLDSSTKTISVGWAYVGGQYECVLLKAP